MLKKDGRLGRKRLAVAFVHAAVLASGLAGLATFAVSMSEATPASRGEEPALQVAQDERPARPQTVADAAHPRSVRVVYPGLGR